MKTELKSNLVFNSCSPATGVLMTNATAENKYTERRAPYLLYNGEVYETIAESSQKKGNPDNMDYSISDIETIKANAEFLGRSIPNPKYDTVLETELEMTNTVHVCEIYRVDDTTLLAYGIEPEYMTVNDGNSETKSEFFSHYILIKSGCPIESGHNTISISKRETVMSNFYYVRPVANGAISDDNEPVETEVVAEGSTSTAETIIQTAETTVEPVETDIPVETTAPAETTAPIYTTTVEAVPDIHPELPSLTEPPLLTVLPYDVFLSNSRGTGPAVYSYSYSWSYTTDGNIWYDIEDDSLHPLDKDFGDRPLVTTPSSADFEPPSGNNIVLAFGESFEEVSVKFWSADRIGDTNAVGTQASGSYMIGDSIAFFCLPLGEYVCDVTAKWNVPDRYSGTANYVFRVNCTKVYEEKTDETDDDTPLGTGLGGGYIMYKGNQYYPFPDTILFTVIDGVYYEIRENLFNGALPERLSENQLYRFDAMADIKTHKSIGALKYTETPTKDLETVMSGYDKMSVYEFEDGYEFPYDKFYLIMTDESPIMEIGGLPVYRMAVIQYNQYEFFM